MKRAVFALLVLLVACHPWKRAASYNEHVELAAACSAGDEQACVWKLGSAGVRRIEAYAPLCDHGVADACATVGDLLDGQATTPDDIQRATAMAEKACAMGSALGCHNLGVAFIKGRGVAVDEVRGTALYRKACEAGVVRACSDFATSLSLGRGVGRDVNQARAIWRAHCPELDIACSLLHDSLAADGGVLEALDVAKVGCAGGGKTSCGDVGRDLHKSDPVEAARYFRTACAWGEEASCEQAMWLNRRRPDGGAEQELMLREMCERTGKPDWCALAMLLSPEGPAAHRAELAKFCDQNVPRACRMLCEADGLDWSSTPCRRACASPYNDDCPDAG